MGHQAFIGPKGIRSVPPDDLDSSKYSSVAWLQASLNLFSAEDHLFFAYQAIFLTYCLHVTHAYIDFAFLQLLFSISTLLQFYYFSLGVIQ